MYACSYISLVRQNAALCGNGLENRSTEFLRSMLRGLSNYSAYHRTGRETGRILPRGEISR